MPKVFASCVIDCVTRAIILVMTLDNSRCLHSHKYTFELNLSQLDKYRQVAVPYRNKNKPMQESSAVDVIVEFLSNFL
jgi:hypothetical protein